MPLPFEKYSCMYDMHTCIMNQNQQICQFSSTYKNKFIGSVNKIVLGML